MNSKCPACGAGEPDAFGAKFDHPIQRCRGCGTIFAGVDITTGEVKELYDHYYDRARFELPAATAFSLERLIAACEPFRLTNRWLDIGYGEGGLLRSVESHGWKCYGTELSPQALEFGRESGWSVAAEPEGDERFDVGGFDVVTMIEFIEHALQPEAMLSLAARFLRPGGLLYLTTPNAGSLNRRLLGVEWSVIAPPEHLTIWSARGIKAALEGVGLRVERVRTEGLNPGEIMARLRQGQARRSEDVVSLPSRNDVAFALNRAMTASAGRRALKQTINRALSAFGIGDSLKVWAVKGAVMR